MSYAKRQAEHDIKEDLKKEEKKFIPYIKYLNPVMRELTSSYIKAQRKLSCRKSKTK